MSDGQVLEVVAVEDNSLLVSVNDQIIEVGNGIGTSVSPGDYVNVKNKLGENIAFDIAKKDDPLGTQGQIEQVTESHILVKTESDKLIRPKPDDEVSVGDGVLLTQLGEIYEIMDGDAVEVESNGLRSLLRGTDETDPDDLEPKDVPDKNYKHFGGSSKVVEEVKHKVELPLKEPDRFENVGINAPKGVLFYGPPGTGKTYLAKIVANQVEDTSFYSVRGPELSHELVGGTERILRGLFDKAQENPPAIIFFDEIDSMAPRRDKTMDSGRRTVGQLLSLMDGLEDRGQVVVIGTTNLLDAIDPALRRPGRFGREIEFSRPSQRGRKEIINIHRPDIEFAAGVTTELLVEKTNGWTGAHIKALFEEIGEILLKDGRDKADDFKIRQMDIERATDRIQSQINNKEAQRRREKEAEKGGN